MPDAFINPTVIEKTVTYDGDRTMKLHVRPLTRTVRNDVLSKAIDVYSQTHNGALGYDYTTLEREMAVHLIVWWEHPQPVAIAWDLLSPESDLGDKIAEIIGVNKVVESITGTGPTVTEAKNG